MVVSNVMCALHLVSHRGVILVNIMSTDRFVISRWRDAQLIISSLSKITVVNVS